MQPACQRAKRRAVLFCDLYGIRNFNRIDSLLYQHQLPILQRQMSDHAQKYTKIFAYHFCRNVGVHHGIYSYIAPAAQQNTLLINL